MSLWYDDLTAAYFIGPSKCREMLNKVDLQTARKGKLI